jgi:hypothetical protein
VDRGISNYVDIAGLFVRGALGKGRRGKWDNGTRDTGD